jgi:aryl-alcohol dehydrogenase-like predicted oxidoreductase
MQFVGLDRLAIGTVQFGQSYGVANQRGQVPVSEAGAILAYARDCGIDTLDTAVGYGDSERRLGEIGVEGWRIVSKLPAVPPLDDPYHWALDATRATLQRLGVNSLHGILLHRPQQLLEAGGQCIYDALQKLKADGVIRKVGVSIYEPSELDVLTSAYQLDMVQAPFNILDRRLIDSGWMSRMSAQGIELHVRSIFLQGLLLMEPGRRPEKFSRWSDLFERWDRWLESSGMTAIQACIRYVFTFQEIDRVVVGVDELSQLKDIVEGFHGSLPAVPAELSCADSDLINPARWAKLA